jgi:hypothetical protein
LKQCNICGLDGLVWRESNAPKGVSLYNPHTEQFHQCKNPKDIGNKAIDNSSVNSRKDLVRFTRYGYRSPIWRAYMEENEKKIPELQQEWLKERQAKLDRIWARLQQNNYVKKVPPSIS